MPVAKSLLESLTERASSLLANKDNLPHEELELQFKTMLQGAFNRLDLVSRSEFDGQMLVLERTRSRMEALEKQVEQLERQLAEQSRQ